ncbi:MAG: hypothetical protein WAU75_21115 [Solirubrobacteraceae bacterium]
MLRPLRHLRHNVIAYLALFLAVGAGGGYAIAATGGGKTITACANKRTGALFLHTRGRCKRGFKKVTWNQQGRQGTQGRPGTQGPAGAPAVSVWGIVADSGGLAAGQGLAVQHVSAGTYQVTVTAPACAPRANAPTVTVSDGNPPAGQSAGAFPVAWITGGGNATFTVVTGVVTGGSFTATDHTFDVHDTC